MKAPEVIEAVWKKFDGFPMETLTKVWLHSRMEGGKQRDIETMKLHKERYGITGNCFDLALWLLSEFKAAGLTAYAIGHDLKSEAAHVAVIALDEQENRYLCDLGDQWLQPILIERNHPEFSPDKLPGFFPGSDIQIIPRELDIEVLYHRPNGKVSRQVFDLTPIDYGDFLEAADFSQNLIKSKPLLEVRIPYKKEMAHWGFYDWGSFLGTSEGKHVDAPLSTVEEWVERLHDKTGYDRQMLLESLSIYKSFLDEGTRVQL
ncbi:hypothetical protein V1502_19805 [Bacillus sp. SCS-153A]|uniref:hypothetical protein n=1 Tax=Rossellomorea sedimentorum TaxID=3115294 RepID=UPI0039058ADB